MSILLLLVRLLVSRVVPAIVISDTSSRAESFVLRLDGALRFSMSSSPNT